MSLEPLPTDPHGDIVLPNATLGFQDGDNGPAETPSPPPSLVDEEMTHIHPPAPLHPPPPPADEFQPARDPSPTPLPPRFPSPPLEVEYDSDDSESNYEPPGPNTDPPALRIAYLNAMSDHLIRKHPVEDVEITLRNTLSAIRLCNGIPEHITPLTTLKSVRRHLGLNASAFLVRTAICSKCYKPYTNEEVSQAELPATCMRTDPEPCTGTYMKLVQKKGGPAPQPAKTVIHTKIVSAMRLMCMRPSFQRLVSEGATMNSLYRAPDVLYDACDGFAWKNARIGLRRIFKRDGTVADEPTTPGSDIAVTDLGYGLFGALNIDWFSVTKKRSCGAVYLAIMNIARRFRFQVQNVILACVIPGPKEPSLEDLNYILQPIVESFKKLYAGVAMKFYNENLPPIVHQVYLYPLFLGADVPARAKANGLPFHNHEHGFGCDCAECRRSRINVREAYDSQNFQPVDEYDVLRITKLATQSEQYRQQISTEYGLRWSALNELPGWMPFGSAPFDPMHCLYLGITRDFWGDVIEDGYLLSAEQKERFNDVLASLEWPSQIGRLPSPASGSMDRNKADEWRRLASILPFALWIAWRLDDNTIPADLAPNIPPQTAQKPKFQRNCRKIWECSVYLAISLRLFTSWIAYLPDIDRAQDYMRLFCQDLIYLGVLLKPNHHFSMHLARYVRAFGPCYAWWLFAFERLNGLLEQLNLNCHPDDIEITFAQWWIRYHLLHDFLERLPDDATDEERAVLLQLSTANLDRGTLLAMTETVHGGPPVIKTSKVPQRFLNLREVDDTGATYHAVLKFAQAHWPHLNLISDIDFHDPSGRFFVAHKVARPLQFILRNSWRYGCAASSRTTADQYAIALFGRQRHPVKILRLFQLEIAGEEPLVCSLVARLDMSNPMAVPWDLQTDDLGYYVTHDNYFGEPEVILPEALVSPVVTGSFAATPGDPTRLRVVGHEIFGVPEGDDEDTE